MISLNGPCEDITLERHLLFCNKKQMLCCKKYSASLSYTAEKPTVVWPSVLIEGYCGVLHYWEFMEQLSILKRKKNESKDDKEKLVSFKKCLLSLGCHVLLVKYHCNLFSLHPKIFFSFWLIFLQISRNKGTCHSVGFFYASLQSGSMPM